MSKENGKKGSVKSLSDDQLRRLVSNDLASAVSCLNMVRNDPEMMKAIQDIVIQRVRAEEENKRLQPELELDEEDIAHSPKNI